jgi:ABC-type phosphate transport system auxiliary subunit
MPDNSKVNMRSDIFNSVDMSWMYQAFAGAYRDLCRNSLVFGGQRMYHVKQKHTTGLNVSATLNQVTKTIQMFNENKELMDKMIKQEVTLEQVAYILAQNIAKKKSGLSRYGIQQKVEVNKKLLDYFLYQFDKEKGNLGSTVWNLFNALTHWSTHIDDTFERENEKTGEIKEVSMTRIGSKTHTAQVKREDKVREFMNSEDWQNMLAGVFIIPKGANLQF